MTIFDHDRVGRLPGNAFPALCRRLRQRQSITLLIIALVLLTACQQPPSSYDNLPWQTNINDQQHIEVFGIELEKTTLAEAQERWGGYPSLALFRSSDGTLDLEGYFERLLLGPFQVKMIVRLKAAPTLLAAMQSRGGRPEPGPSGDYRFSLSEADARRAMSLPIEEASYVPSYHIEGKLLRARFGEPASIRTLNENTRLWLYPSRGILVTIQNRGKDIIHYVNPGNFSRMLARMKIGSREGEE